MLNFFKTTSTFTHIFYNDEWTWKIGLSMTGTFKFLGHTLSTGSSSSYANQEWTAPSVSYSLSNSYELSSQTDSMSMSNSYNGNSNSIKSSISHTSGKTTSSFNFSRTETDMSAYLSTTSYPIEGSLIFYETDEEAEAEISLSTAFAFADGHFAISNKVGNGFVLFYPNKNIRDFKIQAGDSKSNRFLSAIQNTKVNTLAEFTYDKIDHPIVQYTNQTKFGAFSRKYVGYTIEIGTEKVFAFDAKLNDAITRQPLAYQFSLIYHQSKQKQPSMAFTDDKGTISASNLEAGTYYISADGYKPYKFTVDTLKKYEIIHLGTIYLEPQSTKVNLYD